MVVRQLLLGFSLVLAKREKTEKLSEVEMREKNLGFTHQLLEAINGRFIVKFQYCSQQRKKKIRSLF